MVIPQKFHQELTKQERDLSAYTDDTFQQDVGEYKNKQINGFYFKLSAYKKRYFGRVKTH